jgi:serine/threonine-protein kinase
MTAVIPKTLGRYEIRSEIGRGMMGVVYEAHDPALGRTVALKTIQVLFAISDSERQVFEQRFVTEARLAAGLSHPNIVVVHDVGRDEATGTPYIALEYLKGRPLSDMVPPPMEWREALRICGRLANALHHAHAQAIVHRDVKPANVMVLPSGQPKIMDFGIARAPASQLTAAGEFFGTPSYMSPEQAMGENLDGRSDIFSLGAVLYLLLTGQRAFDGKSVPAILAKVERVDPDPPSSVAPEVPAAADRIVAHCLSKHPDHRYQNGLELEEDIEDALADRLPRHAGAGEATLRGDRVILTADATRVTGTTPPAAVARPADTRTGPASLLLRAADRVGGRGLVALAAVAVLGLLATLMRPSHPEGPLASPAAASPGAPGGTAAPSPTTAAEGPARPTTPVAGAPATRQGADLSGAEAEASPAATSRPASRGASRLTIDMEHGVKAGSFTLIVDERTVLRRRLEGEPTKKALVFKGTKGRVIEIVEVTPGEHRVRVEVREDGSDEVKAGLIVGEFERDDTRILEVRVGSQISLKWK